MIAGPILPNINCGPRGPIGPDRGGCGPVDHHHHHHHGGCGVRPKRRRRCGGHHHQPWNHCDRGGRCGRNNYGCGRNNYGCGRNNWHHSGTRRCGNKCGGLRSALEFLNPITGIGNPLVATKQLGGLLGGLFGR